MRACFYRGIVRPLTHALRSPEHQRADWKRHKKECATLRDAPAAPPKPSPAEAAARAAATVAAGAEDDAALAALSVRELRERVEARGLDGSRCIEKDDLVRLLQGARIQSATALE